MTFTHITEVIQRRLGWCPNAGTIRTEPAGGPPAPLIATSPVPEGGSGGSGRIDRGISLAIGSIKILFRNRRLLGFSLLIGLVVMFSLATSLLISYFSGNNPLPGIIGSPGPALYPSVSFPFVILTFITELFSSFAGVFLLAGLLFCVSACFSGTMVTVREGLAHAGAYVRPLMTWAVIFALAGTLTVLVQEYYSGNVLATFVALGVLMLFSVVTLFVVPIVIFENKGMAEAARGSVSMFLKTWGEIIVSAVIFGLIFMAVAITTLVPIVALAFTPGSEEQMTAAGNYAIGAYLVVLIVIMIVASALVGIVVAGLYSYAKTARLPALFTGSSGG